MFNISEHLHIIIYPSFQHLVIAVLQQVKYLALNIKIEHLNKT